MILIKSVMCGDLENLSKGCGENFTLKITLIGLITATIFSALLRAVQDAE